MNSIETRRAGLQSWPVLRRAKTFHSQPASLRRSAARALTLIELLIVMPSSRSSVSQGKTEGALQDDSKQSRFTRRTAMTNKFESYATLLKRWGIGLGVVAGLFSTAQAQLNFTRVTSGPLDVANSLGAAWVDIDNDGDLDLYVTNEDGANLLYRNEGNGVF